MATLNTLEDLLLRNVVDLRFVRRRPKAGQSPTRRMLCTKSYDLLNTTNGRIVLNYAPPVNPKKLNEQADNALVVWDILMQDYRIVSCDQVDVVETIPANDEFWKYFNEKLLPMSGEQKLQFMNS